MKKIFLICMVLLAFTFEGPKQTFNDQAIQLIEQNQFPNAKIYTDSIGNQYYEVKLRLTKQGILVPENGTPMEGYILFPTSNKALTEQNLQDIFKFIDYLDLFNRVSPDK